MRKVLYLRIVTVLVSCVILLSGCNGNKKNNAAVKKYSLPQSISVTESGTVAENDSFKLDWDKEKAALILVNTETGNRYSSIPWKYYNSDDRSNGYTAAGLCSSIYISYINSEDLEQELNSYSDASYIESRKLKNGIRLTYYFDSVNISVPVDYTLNSDGISAGIVTSGIREGENKLYSVSVLPFFASVNNGSDAQLFVPSGSGALMNTDETREARTYSEPVYGGDTSAQEMYKNISTEKVRMPVFGTVKPGNGILGIIENGAETAYINANAGDKQYENSSVYAKFTLRSKANAIIKDNNNLNAVIGKYTDGIVDAGKLTVRYIILKPEYTGYMGLVKAYRDYLNSEYKFSNNGNTPQVMLNILGGVRETEMLLGIPYSRTAVMTDFEDVRKILEELRGISNADIAVNLKGFGASGIDSGKLASDFELSGIYGSKKDFNDLKEWCGKNSINMFLDFDVIHYSKSGGGYSIRKAAKNATDTVAEICNYDIVTHARQNGNSSYLLGRYALARIGDDLLSAANKYSVPGIGLSSLSSICYSDSADALYFAGAHMSDDVQRAINSLKNKNFSVMSDSANIYAAVLSGCVINTPTKSSGYSYFDAEIPFYQMVMRGFVPLSGGIINLADDPEKEFLRTVSTGCSLGFTLTARETAQSVKTNHPETGYTVYSGLSADIADMIGKTNTFLSDAGSSGIADYTREGDLVKTVFENGVTVYVNFGNKALKTPVGEVAGSSFIYTK